MQFSKTVLIGLLLSLLCLQAFGQTADDIISKNLEAKGGLQKLKAIKSTRLTGKMLMQNMEMPFTLQIKRPNSMRMDMTIQGRSMVQAFNGETAWAINPFAGAGEPEKAPEEQAKSMKEQADIDGPLVDYKDKGHSVELVGKEEMEGTEVYNLKVTLKSGDVRYFYLDAKSFLELKMSGKQKIQGTEVDIETFFGDYKKVDGIPMAHSLDSRVKGRTVFQMIIDKVELGAEADDSIFTMPKKP